MMSLGHLLDTAELSSEHTTFHLVSELEESQKQSDLYYSQLNL